ncbi:MAG: hypothetical protein ACI9XO_004401 [Paraglaciecola sp.]|jgi:hypothetical protein
MVQLIKSFLLTIDELNAPELHSGAFMFIRFGCTKNCTHTSTVFCERCTCLEMSAQRVDPFGNKVIFSIL